jgi:hypothetical protein
MSHKISRDTGSYNQRRYSKPWIARVDFGKNPNGDFTFGDWVGDHYNGSSGLLVIEANTGDIIATGQKDFRQPKNSTPDWYVVDENGKLCPLEGRKEAYQLSVNKGAN